jgi:GNAT superfamily N-acetyltransferase
MGVQIRPVRRRDTAQLVGLLGQLGYPTDSSAVGKRLDYWLDDAASYLVGADDNGDLVGVAALHIVPMLEVTGRFGRLVALVVDGRHRGLGVGRQLVEAIEQRAWATGCIRMEVTSSRHRQGAHRFYSGMGYEDVCHRSARFIKQRVADWD